MCTPSSPAPSSSTSVVDLPDWAKGYAKDTLAKTAALTDIGKNPYQTYGGQRIAGFQPLQEQAMKNAASMNAGPEGFAQGISSYMSPYMQNVVDIEKREAARQAGIAGTQQQAQATQAGAFGGGRDAIMRAERERNLAQQMGDIQAKGSQAAYEQAANQFRQGIQQQGALTQLQSALGQQQQAQAQRPLDVAYQDFINQQNYPYKQLGFMSDMIRGLPLGQKSTAQTYEAPGSVLGQLAGIGVGVGGMSKFFADGGLAYADGGVTDPRNVESILSKLSDVQLKQARQAALDRRDVNEVQMIDAEIAQRASIRQGTEEPFTGIASGITNEFADGMEQAMATGGIVAFADRGAVKEMPEKATSPVGDILDALGITGGLNALRESYYKNREFEKRTDAAESMYPGLTEALTPTERARRKTAGDVLFGGPQDVTPLSPEEIEAANARVMAGSKKAPVKTEPAPAVNLPPKEVPVAEKKPARGLSEFAPKPTVAQVKSAVDQLADQQGLSPNAKDEFMSTTMAILNELDAKNKPIIDKMDKMIESQKPDVEAMKSQGLNQALAEFGFKMAANAARPGARFLESASTAAPALSAAAAKTQELITAAQQNYAKLKMEQAKYEVALQKGDMQTAATSAASIRQSQQQDKLLQFHIAKAKDDLAMEQRKLDSQKEYQRASLSKYETIGSLTRDIMQNEGLPYPQALEKAAKLIRPAGYAADVRAETALATARAKAVEKAQSSTAGTMLAMTDPSSPKYPALKARFEAEVQRQLDLLAPGLAPQNAAPAASGINPSAFKIEKLSQ